MQALLQLRSHGSTSVSGTGHSQYTCNTNHYMHTNKFTLPLNKAFRDRRLLSNTLLCSFHNMFPLCGNADIHTYMHCCNTALPCLGLSNKCAMCMVDFNRANRSTCRRCVSVCPLVSVFHKYSLGGDTTAPSGLYARLCHAFSSFY